MKDLPKLSSFSKGDIVSHAEARIDENELATISVHQDQTCAWKNDWNLVIQSVTVSRTENYSAKKDGPIEENAEAMRSSLPSTTRP